MKTWLTVAESAEYAGVSRDRSTLPASGASCITHASQAAARSASRRSGSTRGWSDIHVVRNMHELVNDDQ
jgi:hypothetical protein